jgi:membrane-associated phospholipid phosphatase
MLPTPASTGDHAGTGAPTWPPAPPSLAAPGAPPAPPRPTEQPDALAAARRRPDPLEPRPGGRAERLAARLAHHRPAVAWAEVVAVGVVVLLVPTVLLGLLLTKVLDGSRIAAWDVDVPRWFEDHRTARMDDATEWMSMLSDTVTVVAVLAVIGIVLACCKRWAAVAFLVAAPAIESTVFVTTTFLVDRDRPPVEQLDASPPTDSFPSGHVGAATALWLGLAILVFGLTTNKAARAAVVVVGVLAPLSVTTARLYRGMHHPSDVIVGILIGLVALGISLLAVRTARAVAQRRRDGPAPLHEIERPGIDGRALDPHEIDQHAVVPGAGARSVAPHGTAP